MTTTTNIKATRGVVFMETLKQEMRQTLIWGGIFAFAAFSMALFVPIFDAFDLIEFVETLPPFMVGLLGIGDDLSVLGTPEGVLALVFFAKFTLFFAAYPVVLGLRVMANEESDGTLDIMLSLPITREQMLIERLLAYSLLMLISVGLALFGLLAGVAVLGVAMDIGKVAQMMFMMLPLMFFVLGVVTLASSIFSQRSIVVAIGVIFVLGGYMLQTVTAMVTGDIFEAIAKLSIFTYYDVQSILRDGILWGNTFGMFALTLAMIGASVYFFKQRDLGV